MVLRLILFCSFFQRVFRLVKLISCLLTFFHNSVYISLLEMKSQNSLINLFLETDEVREVRGKLKIRDVNLKHNEKIFHKKIRLNRKSIFMGMESSCLNIWISMVRKKEHGNVNRKEVQSNNLCLTMFCYSLIWIKFSYKKILYYQISMYKTLIQLTKW